MSYRNRVYLALLMLTLIVRALSFHISVINPDEDAFILAARELLHGNLPYLTFFDDKPVGASALLAMVFRLFGATLLTVRLFGAFCVFLAAICIYESGRRLLVDPHRTSPVPLGAAILFIAFSNTLSGLATMTEIMLAPFTCAAVTCLALCLTQPGLSKKPAIIFLAGLCFGLAIWIKTVPVVPAACLGLFTLAAPLAARKTTVVRMIRDGAVYATGVLLPTTLTALVYARAGHLPDFIYANYGFMSTYVDRPSILSAVAKLITHAIAIWPLVLLAGAALALDVRGLFHRKPIALHSMFLNLWLFSEFLAASASLRMWGHNFLTLLPPLAIIAALTLWRISEIGAFRDIRYAALVGLATLIVLLPTEWAAAELRLGRHDLQREAALAIRTAAPADDRRLLVLSYDFLLDYLLTDSQLPQKVVIPPLLFSEMSRMVDDRPFAELSNALAANPRLILVDLTSLRLEAQDTAFDMIETKLKTDYHPIERISDLRIVDTAEYYGHDVTLYQYNSVGTPHPMAANF